jgi:glycoprotein 6-alpha-L-fucosyltransferase
VKRIKANMSGINFTRQILIFIGVWALLIYVFLIKLNSTSGVKESEEFHKLNQALTYLEKSKSLDTELRQLLDEYTNDITNGDSKLELLKRINSKFQEAPSEKSMFTSSNQQQGVPSPEYEVYRKRVGTNIQELWNYIFAEAQKIEKSLKNEIESPQSLKQLSNFVQLAREQKR